ncbi:MAG: hypothetical protein U0838_06905 [Chloroflexota bacterium]
MAAATTRKPFARLSRREAENALYVDFEGLTDRAPVLLGTLHRRGRGEAPFVHQVVLDPLFAPLGTEVRPAREAVEVLVVRAEAHGRRIVAWTEHELEVVRRLCADDPALVARFEARYANAHALARRWANRCHPDERPADGTLASFLDLIGYEVPAGAGPGHVGDTIRAITLTLPAAAGHAPPEGTLDVPPRQRARLRGMREVCLLAARELD